MLETRADCRLKATMQWKLYVETKTVRPLCTDARSSSMGERLWRHALCARYNTNNGSFPIHLPSIIYDNSINYNITLASLQKCWWREITFLFCMWSIDMNFSKCDPQLGSNGNYVYPLITLLDVEMKTVYDNCSTAIHASDQIHVKKLLQNLIQSIRSKLLIAKETQTQLCYHNVNMFFVF